MASRITGLLHARSIRDVASGALSEQTELDFNIQTGTMQGIEIAAVQGWMEVLPDPSALSMSRVHAFQYLDPDGDNPSEPPIEIGDGDRFDADVDDRFIQNFVGYGVHSVDGTAPDVSAFSFQLSPEGIWVPPRQLLLARNPAHGIRKGSTTNTGVFILDLWYYWVRLADSDLRGILSTLG